MIGTILRSYEPLLTYLDKLHVKYYMSGLKSK
jgi:hypothetical protein